MKNNEMTPMGALGRLQSASYSLKELPMSNWCDYNTKSNYATNGLIHDENVLEFAIDEDYEIIKKALEENEELKKKIKALERALDLIKQKRENAKLDLETDVMFHEKELLAQIDTYTDCIATIEAEMGRGKK